MLLPNSISPSLCTVCICTQHICVFVCPLIPNLNICPTSPHNIGPLARPCPLETAINSVLFLPILVHRPMTRKQDQKWAESSVKILLGNSFAIPHKFAKTPQPPSQSRSPSLGTQDATYIKTDIYMPDCIRREEDIQKP